MIQSKTNIRTRDAPNLLNHVRNCNGFKSSVPGTGGQRHYIYIYISVSITIYLYLSISISIYLCISMPSHSSQPGLWPWKSYCKMIT